MQTVDPSTGKPQQLYAVHSTQETEKRLNAAVHAQRKWATQDFETRTHLFRRCGELLREQSDALGRLISREMGKPIREAKREVIKCGTACDYYAQHGARFLSDEEREGSTSQSIVTYSPLGVILAIMPWNFPFWQVLRAAMPTLMAGNALLFKHAPVTTGCALAIEALFVEAGFPPGLLQTLILETDTVDQLIADPRIAAVTITGSSNAGRAVATAAGAALKKCVLELGGSDPFIVLPDADLDTAVTGAVTGRLANAGQSCISPKRFLVHSSLVAGFCSAVAEALAHVKLGDPLQETTDLGPLARKDLRDNLHRQVTESVKRGAKLLFGGTVPDRPGWYYPPTLLADVRPGMPAFDEETFGPVIAVISFDTVDEAVQLANQSRYGLGCSIWTNDARAAIDIGRRIEAGSVFINSNVHSHPGIPFGGVKESGYGRELSREGILEFVNVKAICIS